jgi:hypothetical protein
MTESMTYRFENGDSPKESLRELTDDEIKEVYGEHFDVKNCDWLHIECIRAILKKRERNDI